MSEGPAPEPIARYGSTHGVHFIPRDPAWYRARSQFFDHRTRAFLPADPGAAILDLACGAGEFLCYLRSRGYTAARGIDLSGEQLALARGMGLQNVTQEDALAHLRAHPRAYDFILASHIVEHLPKDEVVESLGLMGKALRDVACDDRRPQRRGFQQWDAEALVLGGEDQGIGQREQLHDRTMRQRSGHGVMQEHRRTARGLVRAALWSGLLRPLLVAVLGDRRMNFGGIFEPELIGVFGGAAGDVAPAAAPE